ncbi:Uncharacterized protein APZ42_019681 [Daphnia magna]|uniref:Uncharacterized protein n=1 Tax=Daphnia magna TaxID=35525 RepID=A0A0P5TZD8_9CRUS|nr:Uncharacterized protein APZ42_019681 [Daphnia magna]
MAFTKLFETCNFCWHSFIYERRSCRLKGAPSFQSLFDDGWAYRVLFRRLENSFFLSMIGVRSPEKAEFQQWAQEANDCRRFIFLCSERLRNHQRQ